MNGLIIRRHQRVSSTSFEYNFGNTYHRDIKDEDIETVLKKNTHEIKTLNLRIKVIK